MKPSLSLVCITIALSIFIGVILPAAHLRTEHALDFKAYYVAGHLALNHRNIYDPDLQMQTVREQGLGPDYYPYIYFPFLAVACMPLATLPFVTAQWIWFILSVAAWYSGLVLLARLLILETGIPEQSRMRQVILSVSAISIFYGIFSNMIEGQVNSFIFLLLAVSLTALNARLPLAAGFCLAVVIMIKPQPILVIPYLLLIRRWKTAAATLLCLAAGVTVTTEIIGRSYFMYYIKEILPTFSMQSTSFPPILINAPPNSSVQGAVSRILSDSPWTSAALHLPGAQIIVTRLLVVCLLAATAIFLRHRRHQSPPFITAWIDIGWVLLLSLLVSPLTWDHHFVILPIFVIPLVDTMIRSHRNGLAGGCLLAGWILLALPMEPMNPFWHRSILHQTALYVKTSALLWIWWLYGALLRKQHDDIH